MAAKFRKLDPRIWYDEAFAKLSTEEKLIAIYCLTSSQTNRIGLFYISPALAAEQLGITKQGYAKGIDRVAKGLGWVFDVENNCLYLPRWWKYNGHCGPKTMKGNLGDLHDVPKTPLLQQFMDNRRYLSDSEFRVVEGYAKGIGTPSAVGEQEQKQEQEQKKEQELSISSEPSADNSEPMTDFVFPIVGTGDVKEWTLPSKLFDVLVDSFPGVDVPAECRKAIAWCITNNANKKTAVGMPKFLNGWMSRQQNNGSRGSAKPKTQMPADYQGL